MKALEKYLSKATVFSVKIKRLVVNKFSNNNFKNIFLLKKAPEKVALIVILALIVIGTTSYPVYAEDSITEIVATAGDRFLGILRTIGLVLCLVKGTLDILKEAMSGGDRKSNVTKVIVRYSLAYASLFFLPLILQMIKELFEGF